MGGLIVFSQREAPVALALPLWRAVLCVEQECSVLYDSRLRSCPACGSLQRLTVACILDRDPMSPVAGV
jgi:hypothetical protein